MKDLSTLRNQVIALSKEVGAFIQDEAAKFDWQHIEYKGLNNLVSYVDKTAEEKLLKGLGELIPESGFYAEEGTTDKQGVEYNWIVDPLDGTTNFIHGLPVYSISIALNKGNETILGVVHELNRDEIFHAIKGEGAYCNQKQIFVSKAQKLSESLVATGFPYHDFEQMPAYLSILNELLRSCHGLRRMGSAAVDLAYVACGRYEAYFEYNLNAWDVAAGAFIVQQAGGVVTDYKGGSDYVFGREIVSGCAVHPEMLTLIKKFWKY